MNRDDVMRATVDHCRRVGELMLEMSHRLNERAVHHDRSKFEPDEFETFARETPCLKDLTYNSPEYKAAIGRLGPALEHHYARNRHHPECFKNGILGMNLLDLLEMLADWKAAGERHANGDLQESLRKNRDRFDIPPALANALAQTAWDLGWLDTIPPVLACNRPSEAKRLSAPVIARVCHEVNRAYCQALGDNSQPRWNDAPDWQKDSAREGVMLHLSGDTTPAASHESWMRQKLADGWTYGPVKDPEKKEHPCLVAFESLPREQQAKDFIFKAVVDTLAQLVQWPDSDSDTKVAP